MHRFNRAFGIACLVCGVLTAAWIISIDAFPHLWFTVVGFIAAGVSVLLIANAQKRGRQ
jgi:hypothetical protein